MFNELQDYYNYIEANTAFQKDSSIVLSLTQLRDRIVDEEAEKKCSYEIFMDAFNIIKNTLKPKSSYQDAKGRHEYPNLQLFEDHFEYLKFRAGSVQHPKLKAKYNHILWLSNVKHIDFAKIAIDSYYEFLTTCTFVTNDVTSSRFYLELFENLFLLSQEISHKRDEVLSYLVSILGTGRIHGYQEYAIMNFIAAQGKKIQETLTAFFEYSNKVIDKNIYPKALDDYLKVQLLVAQKINKPLAPFHNRLAEFYVEKSKLHEGTFVVQGFYLDALNHYKKAGNRQKIEEVSVLMEKAKSNLNLKSVPFEFSDPLIDEYFKIAESQIDNLLKNFGPEQLYQYLILSPNIFPKSDQLGNSLTNTTLQTVSVMAFDQNRNISEKTTSLFNNYDFYLKKISMQHLSMFFQKAYMSGKLSFDTISDFIIKNTWYGEDAVHTKSNGVDIPFKWAHLILPALESFFNQTEIDSNLNKFNHQAYMLCIDSLAIKFEGLLREFSRRIGAQTIEIKENHTEERIAFEKLFENQKFIDLIPTDDIALFRYLFTNQGMNLRNNVAHCFYLPMEYGPQLMWLLISAILKLGAYGSKTCKSQP